METIGAIILLLLSITIIVLCGIIASEDMIGEAQAGNTTEAAASQRAVSPII